MQESSVQRHSRLPNQHAPQRHYSVSLILPVSSLYQIRRIRSRVGVAQSLVDKGGNQHSFG